jgi:hypothetical protein
MIEIRGRVRYLPRVAPVESLWITGCCSMMPLLSWRRAGTLASKGMGTPPLAY